MLYKYTTYNHTKACEGELTCEKLSSDLHTKKLLERHNSRICSGNNKLKADSRQNPVCVWGCVGLISYLLNCIEGDRFKTSMSSIWSKTLFYIRFFFTITSISSFDCGELFPHILTLQSIIKKCQFIQHERSEDLFLSRQMFFLHNTSTDM